MFGAIIGDIVGSVYEWDRIKTKDFPFFTDDCFLQMIRSARLQSRIYYYMTCTPQQHCRRGAAGTQRAATAETFGTGSMRSPRKRIIVMATGQRCVSRQQPS
jgi:hypothetical protein